MKPQPMSPRSANTDRIFKNALDKNLIKCRYAISDRLWVRETFSAHPHDGFYYKSTDPLTDSIEYGCRWKPSIHMPRWASRITLEITDIRVERLQEINSLDVVAEGFSNGESNWLTLRGLFINFWNSINAKRGFGWDTNPYVWVIEFKRI